MTNHDVQVRLIDFPTRGKEVVTRNEDDSYTIFINACLSYEAQRQAYSHAIKHIERGDFDKYDADTIELEAHDMALEKVI